MPARSLVPSTSHPVLRGARQEPLCRGHPQGSQPAQMVPTQKRFSNFHAPNLAVKDARSRLPAQREGRLLLWVLPWVLGAPSRCLSAVSSLSRGRGQRGPGLLGTPTSCIASSLGNPYLRAAFGRIPLWFAVSSALPNLRGETAVLENEVSVGVLKGSSGGAAVHGEGHFQSPALCFIRFPNTVFLKYMYSSD